MKKTLTTLMILAATTAFTAQAQDRTAPAPAPQERRPVQDTRTTQPAQQQRTPAPAATPAQERQRPTQDAQMKQDRAAARERATATPQMQGEDRTARLANELGLTPDQEARMRAAQERRDAQMNDLRATPGLDRTQQAERGDVILGEHDRELRSIMSTTQYEQYQEAIKPRRVEGAPQQLQERRTPVNE